MSAARVLIIEDDDLQHEIYEEALSRYVLARARTASAALAALVRQPPDLIILDHILARGELGLNYLGEFKELLPHVPIVIVSGALEVHQQIRALQGPRRAHYVLTKPVDIVELQRTVGVALRECGEAEVVRQFEGLERAKRADIEELLSRSTDRLSRQNEILRAVQGKAERPNISALARHFRVARRTIIRDLHELIRRGQLNESVFPKWEPDLDAGDEREPNEP